jgi:hypothetical protein
LLSLPVSLIVEIVDGDKRKKDFIQINEDWRATFAELFGFLKIVMAIFFQVLYIDMKSQIKLEKLLSERQI